MKKNLIKVLSLVLIATLLLCGCGKVEDKTISHNGMTMQIPGNFKDISDDEGTEGYTFAYSSNTMAVFGLLEEKAMFEAYGLDLSLEDYVDLVLSANNISKSPTNNNGYYSFTFDNTVDGTMYTYHAGLFEGEDGFWLIQFACEKDDYSKYSSEFKTYLDTVNP